MIGNKRGNLRERLIYIGAITPNGGPVLTIHRPPRAGRVVLRIDIEARRLAERDRQRWVARGSIAEDFHEPDGRRSRP